jgi:hypothetical protein
MSLAGSVFKKRKKKVSTNGAKVGVHELAKHESIKESYDEGISLPEYGKEMMGEKREKGRQKTFHQGD